jgi:hypothetical protein
MKMQLFITLDMETNFDVACTPAEVQRLFEENLIPKLEQVSYKLVDGEEGVPDHTIKITKAHIKSLQLSGG